MYSHIEEIWKYKEYYIIIEGNGTPLQYSCLENSMDGRAWQAAVHGVAKSQTRLSDLTFIFTFMHWRRKWQPTPVLAWRIPGTGEPGGLLSLGPHRVGHDWSDLAVCLSKWLNSRILCPVTHVLALVHWAIKVILSPGLPAHCCGTASNLSKNFSFCICRMKDLN